jgi:hypothetical protein
MARRSGMYKGEKRKKELKRKKKQEEKRQKRQVKDKAPSEESESTDLINIESESSGDVPRTTDSSEDE